MLGLLDNRAQIKHAAVLAEKSLGSFYKFDDIGKIIIKQIIQTSLLILSVGLIYFIYPNNNNSIEINVSRFSPPYTISPLQFNSFGFGYRHFLNDNCFYKVSVGYYQEINTRPNFIMADRYDIYLKGDFGKTIKKFSIFTLNLNVLLGERLSLYYYSFPFDQLKNNPSDEIIENDDYYENASIIGIGPTIFISPCKNLYFDLGLIPNLNISWNERFSTGNSTTSRPINFRIPLGWFICLGYNL